MATVNGLTAEYMQEIVDEVVVSGTVVGDELVLEHHDGSTTNAGNVRGPAGSGGGGFEMSQTFAIPTTTWTVVHGQGTRAISIKTFDNADNEIIGDVSYPDLNTIRVDFYFAQSGHAEVWE